MRKKYRKILALFLLFSVLLGMTGCESIGSAANNDAGTSGQNTNISAALVHTGTMELSYADQFCVDYYEDGYKLVSISDGRRYLVVPENMDVPEDLDEDIFVLKQPIDNIYLVASAVMDMFCELDALDSIRLSGQKSDGWSMEEVQEKMSKGDILYAGKYNMPDYELIISENCSLAIENNMISHSPEVTEKLESFGIPVFIDFSSYEQHPLGRVEWVRLYGALLDREEEAKKAFEAQAEILGQVISQEQTGKTVAFFYITTNGMVNVRSSSDYVPKMIRLAGGSYVFENLGEDSSRSSVTMQMEEFYSKAKDADYLIYNSTIDGELKSLQELLDKEPLIEDFKAVKEGHVFCTTKDLYQQSMSIGGMIQDMHTMLSGDAVAWEQMISIYSLR